MRHTIPALFGAVFLSTGLPAGASDPDLLILDWPGFESDPYWAAYAEKHGDAPTYTFFGEEEEAFQKLRSGFRADVAQPCSQSIQKWREAGLIEPWDLSRIPNYQGVAEAYRTNPIFSDDAGVWFIPAHLGATGIAYNADEVSEDRVQSLQVFLDPAFAGRISLPDNVDDIYALAFLATGVTDWTTATEADVDAASAWLRHAHENVRAYWADGAGLAQLMATGEVLIAWSWNETPVQLASEGFPVGFERQAAEGSSEWTCGYVNLKDGPGSEDKANDFIQSFLDPAVTDYMVSEWGYGHGNAASMANVEPERLRQAGLDRIDGVVLRQLPMDNARREQMIQQFERIKSGF